VGLLGEGNEAAACGPLAGSGVPPALDVVIVYLKNGEKAPLPDANFVKLDAGAEAGAVKMLRCFFGDHEVGVFKWDDVSGYSVDAPHSLQQPSTEDAYRAWGVRPNPS